MEDRNMYPPIPPVKMREFATGATRNVDDTKLDYEGFLSPLVLHAYAEYLHSHRRQADGKYRDADNWQKGMPQAVYMKSMWRHFMDVWLHHRKSGLLIQDSFTHCLCALMFNVMGMLHEHQKEMINGPRIALDRSGSGRDAGRISRLEPGDWEASAVDDGANIQVAPPRTKSQDIHR
jgi:hypothetical protein